VDFEAVATAVEAVVVAVSEAVVEAAVAEGVVFVEAAVAGEVVSVAVLRKTKALPNKSLVGLFTYLEFSINFLNNY